MIKILLISFLVSIFCVIILSIKKYGFSNDTFKIILHKVIELRGLYFFLLYIGMCLNIMNQIDNNSKWGMIPFILCGIAGVLCMYEKTRKIGFYSFLIVFLGSFFVALPIIGLISNYKRDGYIDSQTLFFLVVVYIIVAIIIIVEYRKKKKNK